MNPGVSWALVAAVSFGFTQTINRKSNLLIGAFPTAFGLLVAVEGLLLVRMVITGEYRLLADAPFASLAFFTGSTLIHYVLGWTLLAFSQHQVGVARTGAVVSVAPMVATLLAVFVLAEPVNLWTGVGVTLAVLGVSLVSISRAPEPTRGRWVLPGYGLAVAVCWGSSPMLIRKGLEGLDAPVLGLTVGLGVALVVHAAILTATNSWPDGGWDRQALRWLAMGGVTGAIAIGAQWTSFGLTTVAIAITVQQLATLVVVALAPVMFGAAVERINGLLLTGTAGMIAGSMIVVLAGPG